MPELVVFSELATLTSALSAARTQGKRIALVPTMGNLHAGHISLVSEARKYCDFIVATIFVNPMQFGPTEDLAKYPRTFEADKTALHAAGCDALFAPDAAMIYPQGLAAHTKVSVPEVSALHCGKTRPGHFDGVCTVVCKLFNMTRPDHAFFGLKDFQQFHIISRMVQDLAVPLQLHGVPTVREESGLAMSSRNGYLSDDERRRAPLLYSTLKDCAERIASGRRDYSALEQRASTALSAAGLRSDYFHICSRSTLLPAAPTDRELVILAAVWSGTTRLIDNIEVKVPA